MAVLPYFQIPALHLGPLTLHAFGALAAAGILIGAQLIMVAAKREGGLDLKTLADAAPWAVVGGIIGAHLMHVFGYHREMLSEGWVAIAKVWEGLSSMGGVIGGVLVFVIYVRLKKERFLRFANAVALGTAPGWAIARIGCTVAHDHPGVLSNLPFAVAFPGGARLDMGMADLVVLTLVSALLWWLARKPRPEAFLAGVLAISYSVPRFFLDFLRIHHPTASIPLGYVDGRILGLTPAQYVTAALVPIGIWLILRSRKLARAEQSPDEAAPPPAEKDRVAS